MAWDKRGYFYISRRRGRRVTREYYGKGPIAEMAALLFARLKRGGTAPGGETDLRERLDLAYRALGLFEPGAASKSPLAVCSIPRGPDRDPGADPDAPGPGA